MIRIVRAVLLVVMLVTIHGQCTSAETVARKPRSVFGIRTEIGSLGLTLGKTHPSMYSIGLSFDYLASPRSTMGGYISYIQYAEVKEQDFTLTGSAVELSGNAKYFPIKTMRDSSIAPYICGATSLIIGTQDATFPASGSIGEETAMNIMFLQTLSPSIGVKIPIGKSWFIDLEAKFTLGYGVAREVTNTSSGRLLNSDLSYSLFTQLSGIGGLCIFF